METLGDIVGVWAHPDDETFLMAGLMAAGVRAGRRVVCVTATRGEGGVQDEARWPATELASIRTSELEEALSILGVTEHLWLDLPDGGCRDLDPEGPVARIEHIIRDARPDSVLTFGPDGMTGHPDHSAVSGWTTAAFARAAQPGARLLYATTTPEWMDEFRAGWESIGAFMDEEVVPVTERDELAVHYELPDDLLDLKFQALQAQPSQSESTIAALGEEWLRRVMSVEMFRAVEAR
ncbi:MAG: PIG-L deacetylase family protein [Actinomycetota bacterium]